MKQRVVTYFVEFETSGGFNLYDYTADFAKSGWVIKQIATTSVENADFKKSSISLPRLAITLLLEKYDQNGCEE